MSRTIALAAFAATASASAGITTSIVASPSVDLGQDRAPILTPGSDRDSQLVLDTSIPPAAPYTTLIELPEADRFPVEHLERSRSASALGPIALAAIAGFTIVRARP